MIINYTNIFMLDKLSHFLLDGTSPENIQKHLCIPSPGEVLEENQKHLCFPSPGEVLEECFGWFYKLVTSPSLEQGRS